MAKNNRNLKLASPGQQPSHLVRSIGSIVGGYLTTVVLVIITVTAASMISGVGLGAATVSPICMLVNVIGSLIAAMAGGWVAARIARRAPERHVGALAVLVLVLSIYSATRPPLLDPRWFSWLLVLVGAVGILAGGWMAIHLRR